MRTASVGAKIGVLIVGLGVGGWAAAARAAESDGVRVELSTGLSRLMTVKKSSGQPDDNFGLTQALTIDGRKGAALFGGNAEASVSVIARSEYFLAANGGVVAAPAGVEVTLLGEAGAHFISDTGSQLLATVQAPTVTLPYAGLRLGIGEGSHRGHGDWGLWLYGRIDLGRETIMTTHTGCVWGGCDDGPFTVGGRVAGVSLRYLFGSGRSRPVAGRWAGDDPIANATDRR